MKLPPSFIAPTGIAETRAAIRRGQWTSHTSGLVPDHVQGNVVILPQALADDFLRYCQRNPKPCPVLAVSEPGDPTLPGLGADIDIRSDVPRYRVWRRGELIDEPVDITAHWRDDLVTFVLGCSFSFEQALLDAGLAMRHIDQNRNVAMFRTNIATETAGPFRGPLVVTMRPLRASAAIRAIQITSRFPDVHGVPVHLGDPALIGILDLSAPDYGDAVDVMPDELPVFWACGVTSQAAVTPERVAVQGQRDQARGAIVADADRRVHHLRRVERAFCVRARFDSVPRDELCRGEEAQ